MQVIQITRNTTQASLISDILAAIGNIQAEIDTKDVKTEETDACQATSVTTDLQDAPGLHVDPLTNAPIGFDVAERHPTEDFALYAREMQFGGIEHVIVCGGMLIASDNPVADFNKMRHFDSDQLLAHLKQIANKEPIKDPNERKRFVGIYRKFTQPGEAKERLHLWAIYNTALVKGDYETWLHGLMIAYDQVIEADTREEFASQL